jgi:hypothetical protein
MGAALYWYEGELDRMATDLMGSGLARIDHMGSYACRNVNGDASGQRSEHAMANAFDLAGFQLRDGRRITVRDHWGTATQEGRFLKAARNLACSMFNTVLGPEYNDLHADHFHLDMGHGRICS